MADTLEGIPSADQSDPFADFGKTLGSAPSGPTAVSDRLAILNLIHFYSHVFDGLHTERFGEFFTEDATFLVVPAGAAPSSPPQTMGIGRKAIVATVSARHAMFREQGVQRRHFLTNPVVWDQSDSHARVAVYLQLRTSTRGGPSVIVGTGRYEGRAVKTAEGWRMAEWTIFSDQAIE